jgi:ABC-type glycerol-3-phosphate transport system permease component
LDFLRYNCRDKLFHLTHFKTLGLLRRRCLAVAFLSLTVGERFPRRAMRGALGTLVSYFFCVAGSAIMLLPLAWLIRSSVMSPGQIFSFPPEWLPNPFAWQNYPEALTTIPFLLYLKNTLLILVPTVMGTVASATLAAYGFSRLRWGA